MLPDNRNLFLLLQILCQIHLFQEIDDLCILRRNYNRDKHKIRNLNLFMVTVIETLYLLSFWPRLFRIFNDICFEQFLSEIWISVNNITYAWDESLRGNISKCSTPIKLIFCPYIGLDETRVSPRRFVPMGCPSGVITILLRFWHQVSFLGNNGVTQFWPEILPIRWSHSH